MSKNLILITLLILISALIIYLIFFRIIPLNTTKINIGTTTYNIEIAKTSAQKIRGLSGRKTLCLNCGMIFIFGNDGIQPFWMKDTLIPLDMIWIDKIGKIVDIKNITEIDNSKKIYQNTTPAKYVLELNLNDSQKLNLKIGDIIDLSKIND